MRNHCVLCALILTFFGVVPNATAQDGFDVQTFRPMPGQWSNFITQPSARPHLKRSWEVALVAHYSDEPLVVLDDNGNRIGALVDSQLVSSLLFDYAPMSWLSVGLDVPVILSQGSDAGVLNAVDPGDTGFGIGDPRIVPKFTLFTQETDKNSTGFSVALLADLFLPLGDQDSFQGEGFRVAPRAVVDFVLANEMRFSANLGYLVRTTEVEIRNASVGDSFDAGLAASVPVGDFAIIPEVVTKVDLSGDSFSLSDSSGIEGILGARYTGLGDILLELGTATGLKAGIGTPDFRVFAGVAYAPSGGNDDPDGDGLVGSADQCPQNPEDPDGFEDTDGCPDPDNDKDGVLDKDDQCVSDPEDRDGFEDTDGCPDPDNDKDGVLDGDDRCPNLAGEVALEGCPNQDTDKDGLMDNQDTCPTQPEDKDGFEDEDGCPDPDNDKDGILDKDDKCPLKAEVFNGVDDQDGCPDTGGLVEVDCDEIKIKERVFFASAKAKIKNQSYELLDQVASVINGVKRIEKIRVEGHTDDVGDEKQNLKLSRARANAVRDYLISKGVQANRLEAEGFGESKPAVSIQGLKARQRAAARAKNRRVQFVIVKQGECKK